MSYWLYKFEHKETKNLPCNRSEEEPMDLRVFTPSIRGGYFLPGEKAEFKKFLVRFMFQTLTLGKSRIYYVQEGGELVHTSYVVPACSKFPFMDRKDLEIGPCYTYPAFRGKGIYQKALAEICRVRGNGVSSFYMIVDETNLPSIRGIEKAGFVRCGLVNKSKLIKRYNLVR